MLDRLERLFENLLEPDELFPALMPALGAVLPCDRCFLYLREPIKNQGIITHCWARDGRAAEWLGADWLEGANAPPDPLMTIALQTPIAVFVEDIETAGSEVVDRAYERETFQHRALVHAPIYLNDALIGILECSVFDTPRVWSEDDRQLIAHLQAKLMAPAQAYQATLFNV
ncbi:MAG: GAF domain-containing protein [Stenomitos frigidus ULC029]